MALIECPECHEQMSDVAVACPHCGFPNAANPPATAILNEQEIDSVLGALRSAGMSSDKIADSIREQLHQAGTFGTVRTTVSINGQTVSDTQQPTTQPHTTTTTNPNPTINYTSYAYGYRSGYDYRSKWTLLGLPLLAMSQGYDPATGRKRVAKGWIAIGDLAIGGLAIGGGALGAIAIGGGSVGLISLGGLSVGILAALGGAAVSSGVAVGGLAVGLYSMGGLALGPHANWFMQHV